MPLNGRGPAGTWLRVSLRIDLAPAVRAELIFGIQQRDHDQIVFAPMVLRRLLASLPVDLGSLLDLPDGFAAGLTPSMAGLLRGVLGHVRRAHAPLQGIDPTAGDVWDSAVVGLTAGPNRQYRAMSGTIDFRPISQAWLRRIVQDYGRSIRPPAVTLGAAWARSSSPRMCWPPGGSVTTRPRWAWRT